LQSIKVTGSNSPVPLVSKSTMSPIEAWIEGIKEIALKQNEDIDIYNPKL
jgi:hypothetical protein